MSRIYLLKLLIIVACTGNCFAEDRNVFTVKCEVKYSKKYDDLYKYREKADAHVYTIDIGAKKYYSWAAEELNTIPKLTDSEICIYYTDIESMVSKQCINRFNGNYESHSFNTLVFSGTCKKVILRQIPNKIF